MIVGIGVDTVYIPEIGRLSRIMGPSYLKGTFNEAERQEAERRPDKEDYFATRFAVKEAVYKAIAHLTHKKDFDFRKVTILNHPDGSPYIVQTDFMKGLMEEVRADRIHVSITTEEYYATAFVIVEQD